MLVAFKSWGYMQESPEQNSQWLSSAWTGGYLDYLGWKQRNGLYVEVGTDVCRPYRTHLKRCRKRKSLGKENQRILGKVDKIEHLPDCQFRHFSERSLACDAEILALDWSGCPTGRVVPACQTSSLLSILLRLWCFAAGTQITQRPKVKVVTENNDPGFIRGPGIGMSTL